MLGNGRFHLQHTALFFLIAFGFSLVAGCRLPGVDSTELPVAVLSGTESFTEVIISVTASEVSPAAETLIEPIPSVAETLTRTVTLHPTVTASATPSPTISLTPTPSRRPSLTPTRTRTRWPSRTPTITPTPEVPAGYTRILQPGRLSKVISPFFLESATIPGSGNNLILELIGEDERMIFREVIRYLTPSGARVNLFKNINFQIPNLAEAARIRLYTLDGFGRTISLNSVDIFLLSIGEPELTPPNDILENYVIRWPYDGLEIEGGTVLVRGQARAVTESPLIIELVDTNGVVIGSKQVTIDPPEEGATHSVFRAEIPYNVASKTNVRVTVRQVSTSRISGTVALSSVQVFLLP